MMTIDTREPWPVLKTYDQQHLLRIAMPIGGIGTGTVSLGGRGNLQDWEVVNRPAKGFTPKNAFFALYARPAGSADPHWDTQTRPATRRVVGIPDPLRDTRRGKGVRGEAVTRALEGPIDPSQYEGDQGSDVPNHSLPRFRYCQFKAAYPLAQVLLSDPQVPVEVRLEAFNPLVPPDANASGIPVAVLRYVLTNRTDQPVSAAVCGSLQNFIGADGSDPKFDWTGRRTYDHQFHQNTNEFRASPEVCGIFMSSDGLDPCAEAYGTLVLATLALDGVTYRTAWANLSWGDSLLDFWDDFSQDGQLEAREPGPAQASGPADWAGSGTASLAVSVELPPHGSRAVTFLLAWRFPNRQTWTPSPAVHAAQPAAPGDCDPESGCCDSGEGYGDRNTIGNYYAHQFRDAWDVARQTAPRLAELEARTVEFVQTFLDSSLPEVVKEAALFNLSTLRSQTCFRTPDGRFFGYEGCNDHAGCCHGSCTHVWNYEQATAFLFGSLARSMREVEFRFSTDAQGLMSFRTNLPLNKAVAGEEGPAWGKAAADGQLGCLMKLYRDWQLSGDETLLRALWPQARKALEFCWMPRGWDADQDGVMEGCQHNTMDVEYYGPNPQMGIWYLGALRAMEEMGRAMGETGLAEKCRRLFEYGRAWLDAHLFNGEYYEHEIRPPLTEDAVAPGLRIGSGAANLADPELQLGAGCLVDQLVGQYMAHVCGLGYLVDPEHIRTTLDSLMKYNFKPDFYGHFNHLRSFVLNEESALVMASYPHGKRPRRPFPYYNEVMTGFEYTAGVHMLYEGQLANGLKIISAIRRRYDGRQRSPFDEAECGHHYARAMASWAAVLALTGFHYSGVEQRITFALADGPAPVFWSNGNAWGRYRQTPAGNGIVMEIEVLGGKLALHTVSLTGVGTAALDSPRELGRGEKASVLINEPG